MGGRRIAWGSCPPADVFSFDYGPLRGIELLSLTKAVVNPGERHDPNLFQEDFVFVHRDSLPSSRFWYLRNYITEEIIQCKTSLREEEENPLLRAAHSEYSSVLAPREGRYR